MIELLVVFAVIAILAVVAVILINPGELLKQSRDSTRLNGLQALDLAITNYKTSNGAGSLGTVSTTYISIPDPTATSTAGDQCQGLGMPALPSGWVYHCAASSTYKLMNGKGWVPLNLTNTAGANLLGTLPVDPTNTTSSGYYYTYVTDGTNFELNNIMESAKYSLNGSNDKVSTDGGILPDTYEVGSSLALMTADRGPDVVSEWLLDEGTGLITYDSSIYEDDSYGLHVPSWVSGMKGYALTFNGTNGDIQANEIPQLVLSGSFTLSAWVKLSALPGSGERYIVIEKDNSDNSTNYQLAIDNGHYSAGTGWVVNYNSTGCCDDRYVKYAATPSTGVWYHIAGVLDRSAGTETLYVDGVQVAATSSVAGLPPEHGGGTVLGLGESAAADNEVNGTIDDLRIYDKALSASAVKQIYQAGGGT